MRQVFDVCHELPLLRSWGCCPRSSSMDSFGEEFHRGSIQYADDDGGSHCSHRVRESHHPHQFLRLHWGHLGKQVHDTHIFHLCHNFIPLHAGIRNFSICFSSTDRRWSSRSNEIIFTKLLRQKWRISKSKSSHRCLGPNPRISILLRSGRCIMGNVQKVRVVQTTAGRSRSGQTLRSSFVLCPWPVSDLRGPTEVSAVAAGSSGIERWRTKWSLAPQRLLWSRERFCLWIHWVSYRICVWCRSLNDPWARVCDLFVHKIKALRIIRSQFSTSFLFHILIAIIVLLSRHSFIWIEKRKKTELVPNRWQKVMYMYSMDELYYDLKKSAVKYSLENVLYICINCIYHHFKADLGVLYT